VPHLFTLFSCLCVVLKPRPIYFVLSFTGLSLDLKTNHGAVGSPRPLAIGLEPSSVKKLAKKKLKSSSRISSKVRSSSDVGRGFFSFLLSLVASFVFAKVRHESTQLPNLKYCKPAIPPGWTVLIAHLYYSTTSTWTNVGTSEKNFVEKNLRRKKSSSEKVVRKRKIFVGRNFVYFGVSRPIFRGFSRGFRRPRPQLMPQVILTKSQMLRFKVQGQVGQHQIKVRANNRATVKVSQLGGGVAQSARRSQSCS
jgi:hypothetical protein